MRVVTAVLLALLLAGCAGNERVAPMLEPKAGAPIWPETADQARYAYVGTLSGEQDFFSDRKEGKSLGLRVLEVAIGYIFGEQKTLKLGRPVSGLVDGKSRILVTDAALQGVVVFDLTAKTVSVWKAASGNEEFRSPVGIVEDGRGGFLVTDSERGKIYRLDGQGHPGISFGKESLTRPTGIARDPITGKIYVADTNTHRVVVFNDAGDMLDTLGGRGPNGGRFNYPTHLAYRNGRLYVADTLNFRVQILDLATDGQVAFGQAGLYVGDMTRPKGIALGSDGRIYVVESFYDHLLVYDTKGRLLLPIGGHGVEPGHFNLPAGVWTDNRGRVYVADMFNGRICIFQELSQGGIE